MQKDNKWIEDALSQANAMAEEAMPISERIADFLEKYEPSILDSWRGNLTKNAFVKVARMMTEDDEIHDAVMQLAHTYLTAGYFLARHDYQK